MIASIIIGIVIFSYAAWSLYKFIKKSKAGKCSGCSEGTSCSVSECNDKK
ncbi:MAG: FeoB-associated Cys-rich membrane protein [Anaerobacillus sp.]